MLTRLMPGVTLLIALLLFPALPSRADTASDIKDLQAIVKALKNTVAIQAAQIAEMQKKTDGISLSTDTSRTDGRKDTEMYFQGLNLHIVDGLGVTDKQNGLGNLIVGYNATRGTDGSGKSLDVRWGSHNLIVGDKQNYGGIGGFLAGSSNTLLGPYDSISGGQSNTAMGYNSSVGGGCFNTVLGQHSSISGGYNNTAEGMYTSVGGGKNNKATQIYTSVSGASR